MASSLFIRAALLVCLALPAASWARVNVFVSFAPPPLPIYVQPALPDEGYIWSPGYWAYEDGDYYWIPGTWVRPPAVGLFWTPGYWAWSNGGYFFNRGYWGPHVGFYGGVNYGYGYTGYGYQGGYWNRGAFHYNRAINNFGNRHVRRAYSKPVANRATFSNMSYNGGGGTNARPNSREKNYAREKHIAPTAVQTQHVRAAISNREQRASVNQGRPPIAATGRPGQFKGAAVVPARGPLPDRSRQNDDRHSRDGRPDASQASSRIATPQINPARDNGPQARPQLDRPQDHQSRPQQQRDEQVRQQRDQSQRESQRDSQLNSQRNSQRSQQQREQQGQQREQVQREQQIQQQREQQGQQQVQQQREQNQQGQQQRRAQQAQQVQQRERSQAVQQQGEQRHARQAQPRQEPQRAQSPQREQRSPQAREQRREPQGEARRERGRD